MSIERDKYVKFTTTVRDGSKGPPDRPPADDNIPAITTEDDFILCAEDGAILVWQTGAGKVARR